VSRRAQRLAALSLPAGWAEQVRDGWWLVTDDEGQVRVAVKLDRDTMPVNEAPTDGPLEGGPA